jgi:pimeloyl-ACP methyl ester carboxylesterase
MNKVHYQTIVVDGVDLFYREAGDSARPTLLLLHGFPTSSHMFRDLIPLLADRFHLIAPDELPYTMRQYLEGVVDPALVSPDAWNHAQWGMDRPGNQEIQYRLHADYATNFARYDEWHAYFRDRQPPTLVIWGDGDFVFGVDGARAYTRDLPEAELHVIGDAAHFALETHAAEIVEWTVGFMGRRVTDHESLHESQRGTRS